MRAPGEAGLGLAGVGFADSSAEAGRGAGPLGVTGKSGPGSIWERNLRDEAWTVG